MNNQEKEYLDKKFADFNEKLMNPEPEAVFNRAKTLRKQYKKYYIKWIIIIIVIMVGTIIISYRFFGLI